MTSSPKANVWFYGGCRFLSDFFTLDAAQSQSAMGDDLSAAQVVEAVAGLVAKSLVSVDTVDVTSRYRLLDTPRLRFAEAKSTPMLLTIQRGVTQSISLNSSNAPLTPDQSRSR